MTCITRRMGEHNDLTELLVMLNNESDDVGALGRDD